MTDDNVPLVSNAIVSDIRDDINNAFVLCSFNDYGICYTEQAKLADDNTTKLINNFELVLYPFKTVYGLNNYREFINSFNYTTEPINEIKTKLENLKTISHIFKNPLFTRIT